MKLARLPATWAPLLYGVIQSAITTAIATGIAVYRMAPDAMSFFTGWGVNWLVSWIAMLPVVILVSPLLRRAVARLTDA